jgi:hypothetical protein
VGGPAHACEMGVAGKRPRRQVDGVCRQSNSIINVSNQELSCVVCACAQTSLVYNDVGRVAFYSRA